MAGQQFEGMTGEDVFQRLKQMSPQERALPLCFSYDYGDHSHQTIAPVAQDLTVGKIKHSEYLRSPKVIEEDDDDFEKAQDAIIIS